MGQLDIDLFTEVMAEVVTETRGHQLFSSDFSLPDDGNANIVWDLETRPLSTDLLEKIIPAFKGEEKPHPGEFDPAQVKYGNRTKEESRQKWLEECRAKHQTKIKEWESEQGGKEAAYWEKHFAEATLHATRSEVCTMQVLVPGQSVSILHGNEAWILESFWKAASDCQRYGRQVIGFGIYDFDLPYTVQRSMIRGIKIPDWVRDGNYWDSTFVDIARRWNLGARNKYISLDELSAAFGFQGKKGELQGKDFWIHWDDLDLRCQAIKYACDDVILPELLAARMGIIA